MDPSIGNVTGSTYILLIFLEKAHSLLIGKLGWNHLEKGYYIYIGSARKNIKHRLARHFLRKKKKHWHIDYILSDPYPSTIVNIWIHQGSCECTATRELGRNEYCQIVKKGLGSSDCQCVSHFFKIDKAALTHLFHQLSEMGFSAMKDPNSCQSLHRILSEIE